MFQKEQRQDWWNVKMSKEKFVDEGEDSTIDKILAMLKAKKESKDKPKDE